MRRDWILGFGAMSTLAVLVGLDLLVALAAQRGAAASRMILRGARQPRRIRASGRG
jgi:hypothetical protein